MSIEIARIISSAVSEVAAVEDKFERLVAEIINSPEIKTKTFVEKQIRTALRADGIGAIDTTNWGDWLSPQFRAAWKKKVEKAINELLIGKLEAQPTLRRHEQHLILRMFYECLKNCEWSSTSPENPPTVQQQVELACLDFSPMRVLEEYNKSVAPIFEFNPEWFSFL